MKEANWFTKKQVAGIFGCSSRTVERWIKDGKLSPTTVQGKYGKQTMINPEEVEALKELEASLGIDRGVTLGQTTLPLPQNPITPTLVNQAISEPLNALVEAILDHRAVPIHQKLMLTLKEAQALSGMSRSYLLEAIEGKKLKAQVIGRGWKVKRADLEKWVAKI